MDQSYWAETMSSSLSQPCATFASADEQWAWQSEADLHQCQPDVPQSGMQEPEQDFTQPVEMSTSFTELSGDQSVPAEGMVVSGFIKSYSEVNGYGFITSPSLPRDARFQRQDVPPTFQGINLVGKEVTFHAQALPDGKLRVRRMEIKEPAQAEQQPASVVSSTMLFGYVKMCDHGSGFGTIQAPGIAEDIYFRLDPGMPTSTGQQVHFDLDWAPDGSALATSITLGSQSESTDVVPSTSGMPSASAIEASMLASPLLSDGLDYFGVIKSYGEGKGFGFVTASDPHADVYFQKRDLTQGAHIILQSGFGLVGTPVTFKVQKTPCGRKWHARAITPTLEAQASQGVKHPAPAPCQATMPPVKAPRSGPVDRVPSTPVPGIGGQPSPRVTGTIKSFNVGKGFGFITGDGVSGDVFFLRSELPAGVAAMLTEGLELSGRGVNFELSITPEGKLRAKGVILNS